MSRHFAPTRILRGRFYARIDFSPFFCSFRFLALSVGQGMALEILLGLGCTQADPKKKFQPDLRKFDGFTPKNMSPTPPKKAKKGQKLAKVGFFLRFWACKMGVMWSEVVPSG